MLMPYLLATLAHVSPLTAMVRRRDVQRRRRGGGCGRRGGRRNAIVYEEPTLMPLQSSLTEGFQVQSPGGTRPGRLNRRAGVGLGYVVVPVRALLGRVGQHRAARLAVEPLRGRRRKPRLRLSRIS